jgi:hypothetical protein
MSAERCSGVGRSTIVNDEGDGIHESTYLHGFGRDGELIGQSGPYSPDQAAAIEQGRKAMRRLGARHVVRVRAATTAAAAEQAVRALQDPDTDTPPEPRSLSDRIGRVAAKVGIRLTRP